MASGQSEQFVRGFKTPLLDKIDDILNRVEKGELVSENEKRLKCGHLAIAVLSSLRVWTENSIECIPFHLIKAEDVRSVFDISIYQIQAGTPGKRSSEPRITALGNRYDVYQNMFSLFSQQHAKEDCWDMFLEATSRGYKQQFYLFTFAWRTDPDAYLFAGIVWHALHQSFKENSRLNTTVSELDLGPLLGISWARCKGRKDLLESSKTDALDVYIKAFDHFADGFWKLNTVRRQSKCNKETFISECKGYAEECMNRKT